MGDDILEEMEDKNGMIFDEYDSSFGEEQKMDYDNYYLCGENGKNTREIYIFGSMNQTMEKDSLWRVTTLFIYQIIFVRGGLFISKLRWP